MQRAWPRASSRRVPDLKARQLVDLKTVGGPFWSDAPVAIVAGGPSLKGFDFEQLPGGCRVLAVSASMFDIPFADAGFCLDHIGVRAWWEGFKALSFPVWIGADEPCIYGPKTPPSPNMQFIRRTQHVAASVDPAVIHGGGTSGFGALNLAILKGAKSIFLFGFDYGTPGGDWHHNERSYNFSSVPQDRDKWSTWADNFDCMKPLLRSRQVSIINCSVESAITAFPRATVRDGICLLRTQSRFS